MRRYKKKRMTKNGGNNGRKTWRHVQAVWALVFALLLMFSSSGLAPVLADSYVIVTTTDDGQADARETTVVETQDGRHLITVEDAGDADTDADAAAVTDTETEDTDAGTADADEDADAVPEDAEETPALFTGDLTAEAGDCTIAITCTEEAGIPAGAHLAAVEILPESAQYDAYAAGAAEALNSTQEALTYLRLFDLQILTDEDEPVQPEVSVQVRIDDPAAVRAAEEQPVEIVHFAEETGEVPEDAAEIIASELLQTEGDAEVFAFTTSGFSVYAIASAAPAEETAEEPQRFAIINTYNNNAVQGAGHSKYPTTRLAEIRIAQITENGQPCVTANEEISFWNFTPVGENTWTIRTDAGLYLVLRDDVVTLTAAEEEASEITMTEGTGSREGQVRFTVFDKNGTRAINDYNNGNLDTGVGEWNDNGNNEWFTLYAPENVVMHLPYIAGKISVQEILDGQKVVLYRSVYREDADQYEEYAVDGRGHLVRAYDNGDRIMLRSGVSPVWTVTIHRDETTNEPNGYYDFYNEETGMYLSPQSDGSLVSSERPGVLLNGRRNGDFNSTVEKWDGGTMSYFGYRILEASGGLSLQSAAREQSQAFSFAAYSSDTEETLHPVPTVSSKSAGITMYMFDYPNRATISNVTGSDSYAAGVLPQAHASDTLTDGCPTFRNGTSSGATLFSPESRYCKGEADHLFLESVYRATGYYEYSAFHNFAEYDAATGTFNVYQEIGTPSNDKKLYFQRGNFLPYNTLDVTRKASNTNQYDKNGNVLDVDNPAGEGTLYLANSPVNYYFGMTAEATFMQPKNGRDQKGPVLYEFNGDDDLWIYIDGVLMLDIGGVHDAWQGKINFATGMITGGNGGAGGARTIRQAFQNAGIFPDGMPWDDARAELYFSGNTFADYSSHDFKMFYMEHGAGASNLEMRFNLPVYEKGTFVVEKFLDALAQKYGNISFPFQAFAKVSDTYYKPLTEGVYEKTGAPVEFRTVVINGKTYEHVFYMKPGEAVKFSEDADAQEYFVQELDAGSDEYSEILINGVRIDGKDVTAEDGVYRSEDATAITRARTEFVNVTAETNRNELRITKELTEGSVDDGSTFEFRVLLENADGTLAPYAIGEYCLQDAAGTYYFYQDGKLTAGGKEPVVASTSGQNGTIAGVPAGYTVSIRGLMSGTDFYVEEIRNPEDWDFAEKTLEAGTYAPSELKGTAWDGTQITADGQIILREDAHVVIRNQARGRLVVKKVWEDRDFVKEHGPVQVALFTESSGALSLVEGTLRTLRAPEDTVTYVLSSPDAYVVREVTTEGETVTPVEENGTVAVAGETTELGADMENSYIVTYVPGEMKTAAEDGSRITPLREDVITNTLPRLTMYVTDWEDTPLTGASFRLLQKDGATPVPGLEEIRLTGEADGNILEGICLPNGTYYLEETAAPDGYILPEYRIAVTVTSAGITAADDTDDDPAEYEDQTAEDILLYTFQLKNYPAEVLPATGGAGTGRLYGIGAILVIGAGMLLYRRRRY